MNIFAEVDAHVRAALSDAIAAGELPAGLDLTGIEIQEPRDPAHGDVAANAALVLAKRAGRKPREIAEVIAGRLSGIADIASVEIAGPGFLNIRIAEHVWRRLLSAALSPEARFGQLDLGAGKTVHVEYVSANPTGPMHVGHCRGAVLGDVLAAVMQAAGYAVTREYYINDAGGQVDKLGRSASLRYREALGEEIGEIPAGLYPGDYLTPIGAALAAEHGRSLLAMDEAAWLPITRSSAIEALLAEIREGLAALGVRHDVFFSERSLTEGGEDQVAAAIALLREKGFIYEGRLPRPKGHDEDEWEDREQTLFRSTAFGDDIDRALMKSDGGYTYFASDVAYHYNKIRRGYDRLYNVLGADHVGYIPRLKAAVRALSDDAVDFQTPVCNLVKVMRDGEPVRMSKRAGTFVALRDVVDEVGRDPVRFMMLMNKSDTPIDFDLSKVVEQSKDNPVFYVQYAHARLASVFRNAAQASAELDIDAVVRDGDWDLGLLTDPGERDLLRLVSRYPRVIEGAARESEPHRVPRYLFELGSALHAQWARGNDSPHLRFIAPDRPQLTRARLALVRAVQRVIGTGLGLMGVAAPEEM